MPGLLNPSDVAELKRYAAPFFDTVITFPDVCGVLDVKTPRDVKSYCPGGTSCDAIETLAESEDYDNGVKVVPSYLCDPVFADRDNYQELLIDSEYYTEDQIKAE